MSPDKNGAERTDEVRSRISTMLALADVLEAEIGPDQVREAALVSLSPVAVRFTTWVMNCAQDNIVAATRLLAGQGDDEVMAFIMNKIDAMRLTPARRPRRSRPNAADRARLATEWLAGPAKIIVDPEPESPDGGCP